MKRASTTGSVWFLALFIGAGGCGRKETQQGPSAASSATPTASAATASESAPTLVDLVHRAEVLLVSSSHKDELSQAGFVVDGLQESAWRPNPPDAKPWLELQFAQEVEVRRVSLQAAGGAEPDFNPDLEVRIAADRVLPRQGTLYELALDEPLRTRTLRLSITHQAHQPGRQAAEMAFSELRVEGSLATKYEAPEAAPETRVQRNGPPFRISLPAFRAWWKAAPYADTEALCAAYEIDFPARPEAPEDGNLGCQVAEESVVVEGVAPKGVRSVRLANLGFHHASLLVVEHESGWSPANLWSTSDRIDGMCPGMHEMRAQVLRSFWEGSVLAQERYRHYAPPYGTYADAKSPPAVAMRSVLRCEVSSRLSCLEHVVAFGEPSLKVEDGWVTTGIPKTWKWERSYSVSSAGWLRFSPCQSSPAPAEQASNQARPVVPCFAPRQAELP